MTRARRASWTGNSLRRLQIIAIVKSGQAARRLIRPPAPNAALRKIRTPKKLTGTRLGKITLTFSASFSPVMVTFNLEGESGVKEFNLTTSKNDRIRGYSVICDFASGVDKIKQTYYIWVNNVDKDWRGTLTISCCDQDGNEALPHQSRPLQLLVKPTFPAKPWEGLQIFPWLWYVITGIPAYFRYPLLVLSLAIGYAVLPQPIRDEITQFKEEILIATYWPNRIDKWEDLIRLSPDKSWDQPNQGGNQIRLDLDSWEQAGDWDLSNNHWKIAPGELVEVKAAGDFGKRDAALVLDGPGMAVHKDAQSQAFYDFRAEFKIRFLNANKVRWVLRADSDKQSYYLFEMEKRTSQLLMRGFYHSPSKGDVPLGEPPRPIEIDECCKADDRFTVFAEVQNYSFRYRVAISTIDRGDKRKTLGKQQPPDGITFTDQYHRRRYGNVGVLGPEEGNQILLFYWQIIPILKVSPNSG